MYVLSAGTRLLERNVRLKASEINSLDADDARTTRRSERDREKTWELCRKLCRIPLTGECLLWCV